MTDQSSKQDIKQDTSIVCYQPKHTTIKNLLFQASIGQGIGKTFLIKGHVRRSKQLFVHIYDGSTSETLQLVLTKEQLKSSKNAGGLYPSTTVKVQGILCKSENTRLQKHELQVLTIDIIGRVSDPDHFLPALKNVSMETWRKNCGVRAHAPEIAAIFRIRSALSSFTHEFMKSKDIHHLDPNTITNADCEGAGEMFIVTTLADDGRLESIPLQPPQPCIISFGPGPCSNPTPTPPIPTPTPTPTVISSANPTPKKMDDQEKVDDQKSSLPCFTQIPTDDDQKSISSLNHFRTVLNNYGKILDHPAKLNNVKFSMRGQTLKERLIIIKEALADGNMLVAQLTIEQLHNAQIDHTQDHFTNADPARLTCSSQLGLEFLVPGMGPVYTSNPSFRAEKSDTTRHLASFTHIEAELPFISFEDLMDFEEEYVRGCFNHVLQTCSKDLQLLNNTAHARGVITKLQSFVNTGSSFGRISYTEAIDVLTKKKDHVLQTFSELKSIPLWGEDLGGFCERYLSEVEFKKPIFVYNMPKKLKSFYMRQNINETSGRETVQGVDLLIPGMGELIGGSIREFRYDVLGKEMITRKMYRSNDPSMTLTNERHAEIMTVMNVNERKKDELKSPSATLLQKNDLDLIKQRFDINFGPLENYVGLRKNAATPTGGFGLGFERLVTVCTSSLNGGNIRDTLPFYVAYRDCKY